MEFYSFKYFNIQSVKVFATVDAQIVISNQSHMYKLWGNTNVRIIHYHLRTMEILSMEEL